MISTSHSKIIILKLIKDLAIIENFETAKKKKWEHLSSVMSTGKNTLHRTPKAQEVITGANNGTTSNQKVFI